MTSRYQVFLSHAGEDKKTLAIPIYNILKDRGIKVFLDQPELPGGEHASDNMEHCMETAPIGIFLLRPEFLAKKWTMKELSCFQRRVEAAKRSREHPPFLIPVFYGMNVNDCDDKKIFNCNDESGTNVFLKHGFFDRMEKGETSMGGVLQAVQELSKHTGVVNSDKASNADTPEMTEKRAALVREIVDMVEQVVQKVSSRTDAGSSRYQITSGSSGTSDSYNSSFFVPRLPPHISLDFQIRDANGNYVTVEGRLKDKLWSIINRNDDTNAAVPRMADVLGLTGMGGVGKSVMLIALGYQDDIRNEFTGGIYFLLLGQQADAAHVKEQLARVVSKSGGRTLAKEIRKAPSVESAVDDAATWFEGKKVLFLIDDVWEAENRILGFFDELKRLASVEGRIVVTTRSKEIVEATGCPVYLNTRAAQGIESRQMLFKYAGSKSHTARDGSCDGDVHSILAQCAGLPLALGIAGRAILHRKADCNGDLKSAIRWYARRVGAGEDDLVHETIASYEKTMREVVRTSLDMVDKWGQSDRIVSRFGQKLVVSELYIRLSVLRKQARVSLSMLSKLWGLETEKVVEAIVIKLSKLNLLSSGERIGMHDLLLDVCIHEAGGKGMKESYHKMLLEAYNCPLEEDNAEVVMPVLQREGNLREVSGYPVEIGKDTQRPCRPSKHLPGAIMRAWWKEDLDKDGYLEHNLARHLVASGNVMELRKLLLNARWTEHRVRMGDVLAWESDFAELLKEIEVVENRNMGGGKEQELKSGLQVIRDTVMLSWTFLMQNPYELPFQVFGRLGDVEENATVVGEYLKSIEQSAKKPWLKPMKRCLGSSGGPLKMDIVFESTVSAIAISPTKPRAFVGVGKNIFVVDLERQKIIMKLKGHSEEVMCVAISADGLRVVSGSYEGALRMWNAETGIRVGQAMQGDHRDVKCVAITPNGNRVVSGSLDRTLRVWDMQTMTQVGKALKGNSWGVQSLAITPDGNRVVSGTSNGKLCVWDMQTMTQVGESIEGHSEPVLCVAITPDGQRVVSGSWDRTLRVWDMQTMTQVGEASVGHSAGVQCVAITPDGKRVVSGSWDRTLRVWDMQTMTQVGEALQGHSHGVKCVAITPDGNRVVSGSWDRTLRVWDIQTMTQIGEAPEGHSEAVLCVAMTPDGKYVVSVSGDGAIVWKLATGEAIGTEVAVPNYDYFGKIVQISKENVVTIGINAAGVRFRIDDELGLVVLRNSDNSPEGSIEDDKEKSKVTTTSNNVLLECPQRQWLATFRDRIRSSAFDKRSKVFVIGHWSGAVSFHKLIE